MSIVQAFDDDWNYENSSMVSGITFLTHKFYLEYCFSSQTSLVYNFFFSLFPDFYIFGNSFMFQFRFLFFLLSLVRSQLFLSIDFRKDPDELHWTFLISWSEKFSFIWLKVDVSSHITDYSIDIASITMCSEHMCHHFCTRDVFVYAVRQHEICAIFSRLSWSFIVCLGLLFQRMKMARLWKMELQWQA